MQTNYTLSEITDLEELACGITRHYQPKQTIEQSRNIIQDQFLFGYKCFNDDSVGSCYILMVNGLYMIDAYNEGLPMFQALSVVRKVINETFEKYTDCILSVYEVGDIESTVIRKRLGFKRLLTVGGKDMYFMQKE